jgi:lipopolysaccharide transport system permease protein
MTAVSTARLILANRRLLGAVTRVELRKKYAGSVLGLAWVALQPALLLAAYLFIYMVVFKVRFPGFSSFEYVLYVFCGLVPYLGFMEALTTGSLSLKQNMHLVKNVMIPIELVPVRSVMLGVAGQLVSLVIVLALVAANGTLSPRVIWLPLIVVLQLMLLFGLTWVLASLTVALPDVTYVLNLAVFLLMFLSPIGFTPAMVPPEFRAVVYLNPVFYMIEAYRGVVLQTSAADLRVYTIYVVMAVTMFAAGASFFRRFKGVLVDYE